MKKISRKTKLVLFFFTLLFFLISSIFLISITIGNDKFYKIKSLLNSEQQIFIKKYFFPYKLISEQEKNISSLNTSINSLYPLFLKYELIDSKNENEIEVTKTFQELSNKKILEKYKLNEGFYAGIYNIFPGSGYIETYSENLFVLSSRGVLIYKNLFADHENFKKIQNNIDDFININQFKKDKSFSLKDLMINEDKIYISYTEEIKKDCWNTSIIFGELNYQNIKFKKLFSSNECVHSKNNIDREFRAIQSGGRITEFENNYILLTIGDYRSRHLAQNKNSVNGKVIKINILNGKYELISMGHRNPQGLNYDKEDNFILLTEQGPQGGDEINLIEIVGKDNDEIPNFGWPISSAGEHYGGKTKKNKMKYEKYPLHNSHEKWGFIEPLKSFVPSIAISEIVKIKKNHYVVSSMKDKSLYFFNLDEKRKITNLRKIEINERIRDLNFYDNRLFLFLEDTASIGIIKLNYF